MSPGDTSVSTEVEDLQVLAAVETPGLSVAIAVKPWIDHQVVEDVLGYSRPGISYPTVDETKRPSRPVHGGFDV